MNRGSVIKWVIYVVAVLIIVVLQFTPSAIPEIYHASPMLMVPCVVSVAMFEGETAGAIFGITAGFIWDSQSARLFGFNAFFLLFFGLFVGLLVKYIFKNNIISALLFNLALALLLEIFTWFFCLDLFGDRAFLFALLNDIIPTSLYTLALSVPIYFGVRKLNYKLTPEE